ncbi:hypothetical protein LCGC14_2611250 [marine sediment metagenome]|uniref:Uncharacterized protein n=1 Tax=marine sediment metagenome TaxID=412755 RepID=A0A0F9A5T6_9ZZZZ
MANSMYTKGREHILLGDVAWLSADIKVVSVDETDDAPVLATDEFLDPDILVGAREFTSGNLAGKSSTLGTADATDLTPAFSSATGDQFESITIYVDSGVATTSELLVNIDTATGLPLTPDGGNIDITWSSAADKIFTV